MKWGGKMNSYSHNHNNNFKLKLNKIKFADILVMSFILLQIIRYFGIIPISMANVLYVILGLISMMYVINKKGIKSQSRVLIYIYILTFFGLIGSLANGNIDFQEMFWPIAFSGIALVLLNFKINYNFSRFIYFTTATILIFQIMLSGSASNLETVASRNTISVFILITFSIYAISSYSNNKKITVIPVIIGIIVTVMAVGRSGILSLALLLIFFIIFEFDGMHHRIRLSYKTLIQIIFALIIIIYSGGVMEKFMSDMLLNFEQRGLESVRTIIWSDYISKTLNSLKYIVFGAPIEGTPVLNRFSSNLHNSFLMLHAKYGMVMVITLVIYVIKSLINFIKVKNYLFFSIFVVLLFRMQFDYTNFSAPMDVVFYYFIHQRYYKNMSITK